VSAGSVPNAWRNEVVGTHEFIADSLRVPRQSVRLVQGAKSRDKVLAFDGFDEVTVRCGLLPS